MKKWRKKIGDHFFNNVYEYVILFFVIVIVVFKTIDQVKKNDSLGKAGDFGLSPYSKFQDNEVNREKRMKGEP